MNRPFHQFLYTKVNLQRDQAYMGIEIGNTFYGKDYPSVEPIPGYSVPCRFPEDSTSRTTIYDLEMSYSQTVKPPQITHNVDH